MTYPTKIPKLVTSQELLDLYKTGMTLEEIGQYFGVTRERIRQKLNDDPLIQGQYRTLINKQRAAEEQQRNVAMLCPVCGKEFKKGRQNRKVCSTSCFGKYCSIHPRAKFQAKIEEEQTGFKHCRGCQTTKPISEFYPKYGYTLKENGTKHNSRCKKCQYNATQNWQARNPERRKETQAKAVAKYQLKVQLDPVRLAKRRVRQRAYYQKKKLSK